MRLFVFFLFVLLVFSFSEDRFPKPEFDNGHIIPTPQTPMPRSGLWEFGDVAVLFLCLNLATYLALKKRDRKGLFLLGIFCLFYFGFYKKGCVCSIGAIQNIVHALFHANTFVPMTTLLVFFLPLLYSLLFGRTFCSSVCPLGIMQDIVIFKPLELKRWLAIPLHFLAYLYLGLAVLLAATGSSFIICQYDPFVAFFRFSGNIEMLMVGLIFLGIGMFLARPYCRFFCPYGVLLGWLSRLCFWHVTITPKECVSCRLCEKSCPFGAILPPTEGWKEERSKGVRRLFLLFLLFPAVVVLSSWFFGKLYIPLSQVNRTVSLAERIQAEDAGKIENMTLESKAFRASGQTNEALYQEALAIRREFWLGCHILGAFLGSYLMLQAILFSLSRIRKYYSIHKGNCLSCGRCFSFCPKSDKP